MTSSGSSRGILPGPRSYPLESGLAPDSQASRMGSRCQVFDAKILSPHYVNAIKVAKGSMRSLIFSNDYQRADSMRRPPAQCLSAFFNSCNVVPESQGKENLSCLRGLCDLLYRVRDHEREHHFLLESVATLFH